ncbi:pyruvoyl-dependent arginine decarboxylase (PvlArgDC) [Neorhizobium huautlense]|uniref:Pyruvoyl-dependent arginine decarboxylase (PvlArgDC) n=1 Tax=Neorhizobium huautlense TaxID=67774 RepID=A0ABT9Q087_9HYPH|nr:pyruvoyl-dependent arginine decarboxylase (PvlArgDC) [Neorhizobium huautlense]
MTKFHFQVRNSDGSLSETFEADFGSSEEARSEAVRAAQEMVSDGLWHGQSLSNETFEIVSEDREMIEAVPFQSVVNFD